MELICQNCTHNIVENFCGNCGQKKFKRIDRKYIGDELQYTLVHTNKGFLYSVKQILRNPGKTALHFINGNRINHYKPIGLTFILAGISTFISYKILHMNDIVKNVDLPNQNMKMMTEVMDFVQNYNSLLMIGFIPFLALSSKIAFNDWKQNYYEHVIMNAIGMCYYLLLCIFIVYPIMYFASNNFDLSLKISMYFMVTIPIMMVYFYKNFYNEKSLKAISIRVFLKTILLGVAYIGLIIAVVIAFFIKYGLNGIK